MSPEPYLTLKLLFLINMHGGFARKYEMYLHFPSEWCYLLPNNTAITTKALERLGSSPIIVYFLSSQLNYEKFHTRALASISHEADSSFFPVCLKSYHFLAKAGPS